VSESCGRAESDSSESFDDTEDRRERVGEGGAEERGMIPYVPKRCAWRSADDDPLSLTGGAKPGSFGKSWSLFLAFDRGRSSLLPLAVFCGECGMGGGYIAMVCGDVFDPDPAPNMSGGETDVWKMFAVETPMSPCCERKDGTEEGVVEKALFCGNIARICCRAICI
jgi:hypothetical protein